MKKLLLSLALLPLMAIAGNVKSPNGNIELKFSVDQTGRPVYEMSYKGRAVVKPSFLGLELAKDKHASAGLNETDLNGARQRTFVTTTTSWLLHFSKSSVERLLSVSVCTMMVSDCATSSHSSKT